MRMRIRCEGRLVAGVTDQDWALYLIARPGAAAGAGCAIEVAGPAVEVLGVEVCVT